MPGTGNNLNAEINLVNNAKRTTQEVITGLAGIDAESVKAAKAVDGLEKKLVGLDAVLSKLGASMKAAAQQQAALTSSFSRLGLSQTSGAAAVQKEIQSTLALSRQQAQVEADAAKRRQQYGLQEQSLATQNAARLLQTTTRLNAQRNQIESTAARQRDAIFQRSSKAQIDYAAEAARQGVKYGDSIVSGGISNARYALYDVATSWGVVAAASLGAAAAVETVGIAYEKAFAQVERTTGVAGKAAGELQQQLIDITTAVPSSFQDVAGIAALGGQLGIAADGITTFTNVVAKLTATTDLSAQAAGTALGRFQALLGTSTGEFDNLGSSILKVGVNSVATETQIVNTANQISSMGSFAGLTADQVVGLSGALASVGVAPELARGTVVNTFTLISKAISEGGDQLNTFAKLAGTSSQDFAAAWGTDRFADVFRNLLKGIDSAGGNSVAVLKELGITGRRDIPTMLKLAGAQDVVTQAFEDAKSGYDDNTELNRQFGIVADTTAAKLTELASTIKGALSQFANTGALKNLVGLVLQLAEGFLAFSRNPIGKVLLSIAGAVTLLVGAFAALQTTLALTRATTYAVATANAGLAKSATTSGGAISGLAKQFVILSLGQDRATAGATAYRAAIAAGSSQTAAYRAGLIATTGAENGAALGAKVLGVAIKGALITSGIGIAIVALTSGFSALSNAMKSSSDKAKDYYGDSSSLAEAIKKDTAAYQVSGQALRTTSVEVTKSSKTLSDWALQLQAGTGGQIALNDATGKTTTSITNQTIAIGQNSKQALADMLINNEKFRKSWQDNGAAVIAAGGSLKGVFDAILAGDQGGAQYLDNLIKKQKDLSAAQLGQIDTVKGVTQAQMDQQDSTNSVLSGLIKLRAGVKNADTVLNDETKTAAFASDIHKAAGTAAEAAAAGYDEFGSSAGDADASLSDLLNTALASVDGLVGVGNAAYALGQSLADNGKVFDLYSAAGRANFGALQQTISAMVQASGGDAATLTGYLQGLMQSLVNTGVKGADALNYVRQALAAVPGGDTVAPNLKALTDSLSVVTPAIGQGYSAALEKAANSADKASEATDGVGDAANKAAKQVRTMVDYVSDLRGVLDRAFELRFEVQNAKDDIAQAIDDIKDQIKDAATKDSTPLSISDFISKKSAKGTSKDAITVAFNTLKQNAKDAAQAVADANRSIKQSLADLSGLKADKSVLTYQLGVAQEYGDVLRAQEIQAELAKNAADTADAQAELAKNQQAATDAQSDQNKTLKGNSKAALKNRSDVRDLRGSYTDYIQSLIDAGADQKTVAAAVKDSKDDFLAQGEALGYNKDELKTYGTVFDTYLKSQKTANKQTDGTTVSARDARTAMQGLAQNYQDYVLDLIDSGADQATVNKAIADGKTALQEQGTQLGLTKGQIQPYVTAIGSIKTAIDNVPKNLTVKIDADADPAVKAVNEYKAALKDANTQADKLRNVKFKSSYDETKTKNYAKALSLQASITAALAQQKTVKSPSAAQAISDAIKGWQRQLAGLQFAKGGKVPGASVPGAPNGTDTVPAWLTPGEFVVNKSAVGAVGLPFMTALNNMQMPQYLASGSPGASTSLSMPGTMMVELSPTDRALLAQAGNATLLLNGKVVGQAVNGLNTNSTTRNVA